MICPVCRQDMVVVERNRIELDYCDTCQGVWFDAGELELLLKTLGMKGDTDLLGEILRSPEAKPSEATRRCPICRRKMKKAATGSSARTHIDACPLRDGLWFDGGEVGHLLQEIAEGSPARQGVREQVAAFLAEVFQART